MRYRNSLTVASPVRAAVLPVISVCIRYMTPSLHSEHHEERMRETAKPITEAFRHEHGIEHEQRPHSIVDRSHDR